MLRLIAVDSVIGGLMMARSRGLACLPTVATEGWPGSKGLFDAICIIHQGPWEGVVPSTITLNVYDINYNGGWWDTVPGNANWKVWIGKLPTSLNHQFYHHLTIA